MLTRSFPRERDMVKMTQAKQILSVEVRTYLRVKSEVGLSGVRKENFVFVFVALNVCRDKQYKIE